MFRKHVPAGGLEPRISIPEIWSDEKGVAVRGWILTLHGPPDVLEIVVDGKSVPVVSWHARPKLIAKHPEYESRENCGFWATCLSRRRTRLKFELSPGRKCSRRR